MARVIAYALLVAQFMCNLVVSETYGIILGVDQTPLQRGNENHLEDYVAYLDVGAAYKVHYEHVSWIDARSLCIREGAQLALIDSVKKLKYVTNQRISPGSAHVGIIRMYDDTTWVGVSTGLPVSSIPWASDEPYGEQDCVMMSGDGRGLVNHSCDVRSNYVCEIPIYENNVIVPE